MSGIFSRFTTLFCMLNKEAQLAGISRINMYRQTLFFCFKTGLGPRYFVVAGMARKNFVEQDKWQHISAKEYYAALKVLNSPQYRKLTQSKLSEKALYKLMHIPTPELFGYFHAYKGFDNTGQPLTDAAQLEALMSAHTDSTLCIKPIEGWGGAGVIAGRILLDDNKQPVFQPLHSQQQMTAQDLINSCKGSAPNAEFVLEAYIQQSDQFKALNADSVNTLRIWVLENTPGQVQVIGAYLRVGRAGSAIDNASAGGIMCPVRLSDGKVEPGLTKYTPHRDDITEHPDHGAQLAGIVLEQWQEIKSFACMVLLRLPYTRFAGLDVTMTAHGPVLVETNVAPDKDGAAHANIPSIRLREAAEKPYV
ncbi:sugar-transfer associated ATP-grasp domain-containing protein [Lacimicrobium sp. SS2-24]|uniref:sugar-transfer associated ATP-grasp domain-containing protein n=1 Tax=Lacimicrobium sp. SS2-24 TaxID=2005569 RepID=UPI000B4B0FE5|nr:sugar-transfer associated ATP-grasp domain-containing protein [Lacimicrobium sp. SS2-24]